MRKLSYRKMRFQDTPNYGDESSYLKQAQEYYITEKSISFNQPYRDWETDRKSTRLNSSHSAKSRMPSSA